MVNKPVKDWNAVEAYFEYGLDVAHRRVFLVDDVEDGAIANTVKGIYYLAGQEAKKSLELFIGSFGGSEYEMFALYDVINSIACPITTVAIGKCMSAAPLLIAAGTPGQRYTMPNTQWMIHQSWVDPRDEVARKRVDEVEIDLGHWKTMVKAWHELMAKHTNRTVAQWKRICNKVGDSYFGAEQAVEYGLVDEIWDQRNGEL